MERISTFSSKEAPIRDLVGTRKLDDGWHRGELHSILKIKFLILSNHVVLLLQAQRQIRG
nr:unnamed protein product [Callosobruchus chinensis]